MVIIVVGLIILFIILLVIIMNLCSWVVYLKDCMSFVVVNFLLCIWLELDGNDELCDIGKSFNVFIDKVYYLIEEVVENLKELVMMVFSVL